MLNPRPRGDAESGSLGSHTGSELPSGAGQTFTADRSRRDFVFGYHEVQEEPSEYFYQLSAKQFETHLIFFSEYARQHGSKRSRPVITFDDGHRSNYEVAFPLLEKFSCKAIFFVLTGKVGTAGFVSWEQLRKMAAAGHRIESHGWSHRLLTQCSDLALTEEVERSKKTLEDHLGSRVVAMSAPGGRWSERIVESCERFGLMEFFHSNPWELERACGTVRIAGRLMASSSMSSADLRKNLDAGEIRRFAMRSKYMAKDGARRLLGDSLYHRIWCQLANWKSGEETEVQVSQRIEGNRV